MTYYLGKAYPTLAGKLSRAPIATLPTPVSRHNVALADREHEIWVKQDDKSNPLYGGNKVRKLEFLLQRARDRGATRVATFGAVGSNHALATAIHARQLGLSCTCFLAHQKRTANTSRVLDRHLQLGTELVRWGGAVDRLALYRHYFNNRRVWVIPLGGSCWLGAIGFVNAGLELAAQVNDGNLPQPGRIYIANGTMGSVAGLALGLALARLDTEIHAVRVAENRLAHPSVLEKLVLKTARLMQRLDASIPADLAARTRIVWRDEFLAGGYALTDVATTDAVDFAANALRLQLETTYTGKAMAALLHDLNDSQAHHCLFWNTYTSSNIELSKDNPLDRSQLPDEFQRYYD